MKCPYCNTEMVEGFVQSSEQIFFNRGKKARFFASGDIRSRSLTKLSLRAPNAKGYLCERCGKIIIDIGPKRRPNEESLRKI